MKKIENESDAVVEKSLSLLENLTKECPAPTQEELKKLLGMQAAILNNLGIQLLDSARGRKKIDARLRLVLQAFRASREAAEAASRVKGVGPGERALGEEDFDD